MIKKTLEYTNIDGDKVVEDHYFHLTGAEIIELEVEEKGGLSSYLEKIIAEKDNAKLLKEFKKVIASAYGRRTEDGHFEKSKKWTRRFLSSDAFTSLLFEIGGDANKAAEFINGLVPSDLQKQLAERMGADIQDAPSLTAVAKKKKPKDMTREELLEAFKAMHDSKQVAE